MGTQHINITCQVDPRRQRSSFRRLFIWYSIGIMATTFIMASVIEVIGFTWIALKVHVINLLLPGQMSQVIVILLIMAVPLCVLSAMILFFVWRMEQKISQRDNELTQAVEKIRQQDLNFSINYSANNELGDLCYTFNELRRELQESFEREWRKQEEMRTMVAALSHDLRTPVTIIQGHIEGLTRAEVGEKRNRRLERYLPVLEASSQRMTRLLNDILLVSSLEQTSFVIQPQPVRLEEVLERKASFYQLQAAAREIAFSHMSPSFSSQPPLVYLDLHRVEQILDNLFENALRYTPAHGQISLTYMRDLHVLSFVLRDTGCGIAPQDLPHVFEKFYHGQRHSNEKAHQAAGLGLYTCKLLVERHGGAIAIQNHPVGGCEVAVCLPLVEVGAGDASTLFSHKDGEPLPIHQMYYTAPLNQARS